MHRTDFDFERADDLPDDAYWDAVEAGSEWRRQEARAARAYDEGLRELRAGQTAEVHAVLREATRLNGGDATLTAYLASRREHRDRLRGLSAEPGGDRSSDEARALRASAPTLESLGVDLDHIRRISADFDERRESLFERTLGRDEAPAEVIAAPAKNKTFVPPFGGSFASVSTYRAWADSSDFVATLGPTLHVDSTVGKLGNGSGVVVVSASDYDEAEVYCETGLLVAYKMPSTGQPRVRFKAERVSTYRTGSVYNEWGNSEVLVKQRVRYYARVLSPVVSDKAVWSAPVHGGQLSNAVHGWIHDTDDVDAEPWNVGYGGAGGRFDGTNIIPEVFAKDTVIVVALAIAHRNRFWSNDTGVNSNQQYKVRILEIGVSSTGDE